MGLEWNPSFPAQIGDERADADYTQTAAAANAQWQALRFVAKHTGPLDWFEIASSSGSTAPVLDVIYKNQACPLVVDLYPASGAPWLIPYTVSSEFILPTAVTGQPGCYNEDWTQPITVSRIQNWGDGQHVIIGQYPSHGFWTQFDTAAWPLTRRVLGVRVVVNANATWGLVRQDAPPFTQGNHTWGQVNPLSAGGLQLVWNHVGEVLVDQAAPATPDGWSWWTPQMLRDMRSGGPRAFKIEAWAPNFYVDWVLLQPFYTTETRIGVGVKPPSGDWSWTSFDMKTPAATGSPSVVSGQEYVAVLRAPWEQNAAQAGRAAMTWRGLKGRPLVSGWVSESGTFRASNAAAGFAPVFGQRENRDENPITLTAVCASGAPFASGGQALDTAQPYMFSRGCRLFGANTADQIVTVTGAATSQTYGQTAAIVGWNPDSPPPVGATVRAEVWTVTGAPETRVFSPVERTFAEISKMGTLSDFPEGSFPENFQMRRVRFRHPESLQLPAGNYRIILSAPDATDGKEWRVEGSSGWTQTPNQTYGGATQVGTGKIKDAFSSLGPLTGADASGRVWNGDLQVTLMTVPPAITGVAVAVGYSTAHHTELCTGSTECQGCADQGTPFNQIQWSVSPDVTTSAYEIQRMDEYDPVFRTVALVEGWSSIVWPDYEASIGIRSDYRIRSVRTDGVAGDWSATFGAILPAGQVALTFTSNAATGLAIAYYETWDTEEVDRPFQFLEAEDVTFRQIYGRERQFAFHPVERKGVSFQRTLLVNALCTTFLPTLRLFNPLRIMAWAPIPYVCVRDGEGNKWYAAIEVPEGTNVRPGERWFATVRVTEVSNVPTVVNTSDLQIDSADVVPP